ncbi:hypothetical protein [Limnoglobus roseus]|uniref:Uncharacterized protein n=1 Tax=Limnoglobus roseus TaxID=2598579 RepID=A0A5C1A7R3_9BACT|nr:hypothetical protein [Limnoglobus roseus]QEL14267.1 hypothetical protein PX52LOC_01137 [Limnoglobus roseus]
MIEIEGCWNPDLISFTHDPRGPDLGKPLKDAWGRDVGQLVAIKPQGRASPIRTMNSIREALLEPRKKLLLFEYSKIDSGEGEVLNPGSQNERVRPLTEASIEILVEAPARGEEADAFGGPHTVFVSVREVVGYAQAFVVAIRIECYTTAEGYSEGSADSILLSNSFSVSTALTEQYAAVRRTRGTAVFRFDATARLGFSPESYKSSLFARIPIGWQRGEIEVPARDDGVTIDYAYTDRQQLMSLQDAGAGAAAITLEYDESLVRDADAIDAAVNVANSVYSFRTAKNFAADQRGNKDDDSNAKLAEAINNLAKVLGSSGSSGGPSPNPSPNP